MSDALPSPAPDAAPLPPAQDPSVSRLPEAPVPKAALKPARRPALSWFWILPGVVLVIVILVVWLSLSQRGPQIVVHFKEGYGLKAGDPVRHRGVTVGEVRSVELSPDLKGVEGLCTQTSQQLPLRVQARRFLCSRLNKAGGRILLASGWLKPQDFWKAVAALT